MQLDGFERVLTEDGGLRWWARLAMLLVGLVFLGVSLAWAPLAVVSVLASQVKVDTWKPSTASVVRIVRTADDGTSVDILIDESSGTLSAARAVDEAVSPDDFGLDGNSPFAVVQWAYRTEYGETIVDQFTAREVDSEERYRQLREMTLGETFAVWYDPADPDQWDEDITPVAGSLGLTLFIFPFFLSGVVGTLAGLLNRPGMLLRVKDGRINWICVGLAIAMFVLLDMLP